MRNSVSRPSGHRALHRGQKAAEQRFFVTDELGRAPVAELARLVEPMSDVGEMVLLLAEHALERERMTRTLQRLLIEPVEPERPELDDHRHVEIDRAGTALLREPAQHRRLESL